MIRQNKKKRFVAKKGFVAKHLSEKIQKIQMEVQMGLRDKKETIITWSRASTIIPSMVSYTIGIHNGKEHSVIYITDSMIGHKLGEFAPTRTFARDARKDNDKKSGMKSGMKKKRGEKPGKKKKTK